MALGNGQTQEDIAAGDGRHRLARHDDLAQPGRDRQHTALGGCDHVAFGHLLFDHRFARLEFRDRVPGHRDAGCGRGPRPGAWSSRVSRRASLRVSSVCAFVQFRLCGSQPGLGGGQLQFQLLVHDPRDHLTCALTLSPSVTSSAVIVPPIRLRAGTTKPAFDLAEQRLGLGHLDGAQEQAHPPQPDAARANRPSKGQKKTRGVATGIGVLRLRRRCRRAGPSCGRSSRPGRSR